MVDPAWYHSRGGGGEPALHRTARTAPGNRNEHLANERTHLAYVRTAVSLISLGITVNRFSIYLQQREVLPERPSAALQGTASAGLGMVVFALVLMLAALYRYKAVDSAILRGTDHAGNRLVVVLTLSIIVAASGGLLWMIQP